jgi:hypothetical protein
MFPQNLPDRGRMELHDADAERRMRRRDMRSFLAQFLIACGVCALAIALLYVLTLLV